MSGAARRQPPSPARLATHARPPTLSGHATNSVLADRLRALPLQAVLRALGGEPDCHDKHKWHTPAGTVSITGAKFFNWTCGRGGGGAIDLVMHVANLRFREALDWLGQQFGDAVLPAPPTPHSPASSPPRLQEALPGLELPAPHHGNLARVRHYLIALRGIAPAVIDPLIGSGTLYADARANAVFLLRSEANTPVGAELRATSARQWRGLAPGSRKDLGFFSAPADPTLSDSIVLCESAIDAISCCILHPRHRCLSTSGARPDPAWLAPLLARSCRIYCGFDADPTGDRMAAEMIALHPAVERLRPSQHDWNDVLRSKA